MVCKLDTLFVQADSYPDSRDSCSCERDRSN